jgi:hypothetical protein
VKPTKSPEYLNSSASAARESMRIKSSSQRRQPANVMTRVQRGQDDRVSNETIRDGADGVDIGIFYKSRKTEVT